MFFNTHTHTHSKIICERGKRTGLVSLSPMTPDVKGGLRRSLSQEGRAD